MNNHAIPILRILYIGMKNDYGSPELGTSYEWSNILPAFQNIPELEVTTFPFDEVLRNVGRSQMNALLLQQIRDQKPDICFFVLFTDEIMMSTLRRIKNEVKTVTINWFTDDHWRFDLYSKYWAPCFDWAVTTDYSSIEKYKSLGFYNIIQSQWAFHCNDANVVTERSKYLYDVSFIGQTHSVRQKMIRKITRTGVNVACWGRGWERGRLSIEQMQKIFAQSKVNLNFSESSNAWSLKRLAKTILYRRCDNSYHLNTPAQFFREIYSLFVDRRLQVKARNFEIPGCGGFLLTSYVQGLEQYYEIDKEVVVYRNEKELNERIQYYLQHDDEREAIRRMGHARTLREHTYTQRIKDIFQKINMPLNGEVHS
jgi:spore maturation protein CgeB